MSMPHWLQLGLWFSGTLLLLLISTFMVRRNLHRELSWFFAYTIFEASQSVICWFLRQDTALYFYFYWLTELVSIVIGFVIIYEVFRTIVSRYERVQRVGFILYRWSAVVLLFLATITVASASSINSDAVFDGIMVLQRGVRIIQVGLLVLLFAFTSFLALSWRNCSFGVALGFGFLATVELVLAAVRAHLGPNGNQIYELLKPIAYNLTVLIWVAYVLQRQPVVKTVTSLPATEVAVWDRTLMEFTRR
jgi:hypothetical protein